MKVIAKLVNDYCGYFGGDAKAILAAKVLQDTADFEASIRETVLALNPFLLLFFSFVTAIALNHIPIKADLKHILYRELNR